MKLLVIGDVYGRAATDFLAKDLRAIRDEAGAEIVIVNAENCGPTNGLDVYGANALFDAGADALTGGNHTLKQLSCHRLLEDNDRALRPLNFPDAAPGKGWCVLTTAEGYRMLVLNAMGQVFMDASIDNPFNATERLLTRLKGHYDFAVCDFHAEATSEKAAFASCFDGRMAAIWGTHTHVQTADERVLPHGTGFISDLGMTGVRDSVIGTHAEQVVKHYLTHVREKFENETGAITVCGAVFTIDPQKGLCTDVKRIQYTKGQKQ